MSFNISLIIMYKYWIQKKQNLNKEGNQSLFISSDGNA